MKKFTKNVLKFIALSLTGVIITSCGATKQTTPETSTPTAVATETAAKTESEAKTEDTTTNEPKTIKLGITGEETKVWKSVQERLAKENITLEIIPFADYIIPNTALAEGQIDANAFQTEIFFEKFLEQSNADLSSLGYTILAPMAIYPSKTTSLEEIKDGAKIAIPNDLSNGGRALILLQEAGLIKVDASKGLLPTLKDVTENPKNLEIIALASTQVAVSLSEFDVAVINNGVAQSAKLSPINDSIYIESIESDTIKNYFNIIAVQTKDLDKPELKRLYEVYATGETKTVMEEETKGSYIPVFN